MERLLQYLDDLDDLYGMAGLIAERTRTHLITLLSIFCLAVVAAGAMWFALRHPPIALATSLLLLVSLLYRSVTMPHNDWARQT